VVGDDVVERLVCHGRLPLVAGLDVARPAVHVWRVEPDGLHRLAVIGADVAGYPAEVWKRYGLVPSVAWHP
jgi:hypothetical protein